MSPSIVGLMARIISRTCSLSGPRSQAVSFDGYPDAVESSTKNAPAIGQGILVCDRVNHPQWQ